MIVTKEYEIQSCDDVELGIKRESKLNFRLCFDDESDIKAIVLIVPGLGGDAAWSYRENLAQSVAKEFEVAVLSVDYHCIGNRSQVGATVYMDKIDQIIFKNSLSSIGLNLDGDTSRLSNQDQLSEILVQIDYFIQTKKENKELEDDFKLQIAATIQPTKNEYQNFGIMQSIDLLNALMFIKQNPPFSTNDKYKQIPSIMVGSSHGAYLAMLATKIAPWLVDAVIENSGYAKIHWEYIGFGKEIDYRKHSSATTDLYFKNITTYLFDKTHWTLVPNSPNYFSNGREDIRNILNLDNLKIQSHYPKPIIVGYQSAIDHIAPAEDKSELFEVLKTLGFDAALNLISDESQVDGKFIKTLKHGFDMSIKTLIKKELPPMIQKLSGIKKEPWDKTEIRYKVEGYEYKFSQKDNKIELKVAKA